MPNRLIPVGTKILVLPKERKNTTSNGMEIVNLNLMEGEVIEVSDFLKEIYKPGQTVLYPKGSGNEYFYNGQPLVFLNGQEMPAGDIWAIELPDIHPKDKGDSL